MRSKGSRVIVTVVIAPRISAASTAIEGRVACRAGRKNVLAEAIENAEYALMVLRAHTRHKES